MLFRSNTVTLVPQNDPIDSFSSTLTVDYEVAGVTYSSVSDFSLTGYSDQEFTVDFSLSGLGLESTADFDPSAKKLDYWLNTGTVAIPTGIELTPVFLLQKTEDDGFGAGMKIGLSGDTSGGISLDLENFFGLEEDSGKESGYALVTSNGAYGPSSLQYVSTTLELTGMSLGCVDYTGEASFSEADGFKYMDFDFTIVNETWPLEFSSTVSFTPEAKSVTLDPSLTLDFACFTVYNDISGTISSDPSTGNKLTGLEIQGFSISGVELGHVEFSSYTALGDNVISDLTNDFDYGDDYDEVFRISKSDDLDLTLDAYFDMTDSQQLFDFALLDGTATYDLSDQFTLGAGAEIGSSSGLGEFELTFDYSF